MKSIYDRLKSLAFSNGVKLLLACAVVFAISYFYLLYYRNAFYDLTADEGYIIYGAKRVLDGQILYKDFFQFYPPGDFYLLAFVFKLFGYSFIIARETAVVIDSLINTLLFYLSYKAIKSWYAILSPLFFLILGYPNWMQYSHYWSSMLFLFISLAFFLNYLEQNKITYLYLTGIFTGITGLFLQTPAVYAILLILPVLILEKRKEQGFGKKVFLFLMGIGVPLIIVFGYFVWQGAFFDFIKEQYTMSKVYSETQTFNPIVLYFQHVNEFSVIFMLYTSIAILSGVALIFFRKKLSNPVKIILIGNIVLFFTSSSRMDFEHILVNSAIVFIVVLIPVKWFLDYLRNKYNWAFKGAIIVWTVTAVILILWGVISMKTNIHAIEASAYQINFNGTQVWTFNEKEAYEINEFFPQVEKILNGDKNVFVYPYGPLIYVLMNFNNPLYFDYAPVYVNNNNLINTFAMPIIQLLKADNIKYIIYCGWPKDYVNAVLALENRQYHINALDIFIRAHYSPVLRVNDLILYKKRS
ncbi:MAG: glycosyltransferase family 39 protein [Deltaproteobacteria bacterium]|nr:glycosyltransferase family 39 protein [Deltaproteobacteria bacterium]